MNDCDVLRLENVDLRFTICDLTAQVARLHAELECTRTLSDAAYRALEGASQ
jgi:hypothetical protein